MSRPRRGCWPRAGLDVAALRCGAHWPIHQPSAQALARGGGQASALHNNCSGKHAGFLCTACASGADIATYVEPAHAVQREVKATLESLTGAAIAPDVCAVDGCSVPTWAMPLAALARGFARFGTGQGMTPERAKAAARLRAACARSRGTSPAPGGSAPNRCARSARRCSSRPAPRACIAPRCPNRGFGIAVKCDDGAGRAAEVMMAATMARLMKTDADRAALARFVRPSLRNWNGIEVGELRPTEPIV